MKFALDLSITQVLVQEYGKSKCVKLVYLQTCTVPKAKKTPYII